MEVSGQIQALTTLPSYARGYPLNRRLGETQSRSRGLG